MSFYLLRQPKVDSLEGRDGATDSTKEEGHNVGEAVRCPTCDRYLTSLKWLPPFRVELESWGKHYGDIVEIGDDLIVSDRFRQLFTSNSLRGLVEFEPVAIVKVVYRRSKPSEAMPRYFKASVVRSSTCIDQEASGYIWEDKSKVCPECLYDNLKRHRRLIVKDDSWNGDDIFFPRGGNGPIVSERFRSFFVENGFVGAVFIPGEQYGYDYYPWESTAANSDGRIRA